MRSYRNPCNRRKHIERKNRGRELEFFQENERFARFVSVKAFAVDARCLPCKRTRLRVCFVFSSSDSTSLPDPLRQNVSCSRTRGVREVCMQDFYIPANFDRLCVNLACIRSPWLTLMKPWEHYQKTVSQIDQPDRNKSIVTLIYDIKDTRKKWEMNISSKMMRAWKRKTIMEMDDWKGESHWCTPFFFLTLYLRVYDDTLHVDSHKLIHTDTT